MEHQSIINLREASLKRTRYLLTHLPQYTAQCPSSVDEQTSKAVLDILAHHYRYRETVSQADYSLIDRCGPLLVPAVRQTLEQIREFPYDIVAHILYPLLYHQYFSPEGIAIDCNQLSERLKNEEIVLDDKSLLDWLQKGDSVMSTLLFPNSILSAMISS